MSHNHRVVCVRTNSPQRRGEHRPEERDRTRTCIDRALQARALPFGHALEHAVKGSNLPTPDLEAGVPPLGLTARCDCRWPAADLETQSAIRCVGRESNPRLPGANRVTAGRNAILPPTQKSAWEDSNLHPRAPEARAAAKLSYRLFEIADLGLRIGWRINPQCAVATLPVGLEPNILRLKAGRPNHLDDGSRS